MTQEPETLFETKFLHLAQRQGWVYATRPQHIRVVAVIAMTDDEKVILIEQFRQPTNSRVIEFPAGLVGDIPGEENEALLTAAKRELIEETGFEAAFWQQLPTVVSSAGLTDEKITLFSARGLTKTGAGGGVDSEDIEVHEVPLGELDQWLKKATVAGKEIDSRVYSAFHFCQPDNQSD